MKKIVLALAVVFSVALVSCGNKQAAAEDSANAVVEEAVEVAVDSVNDSTVDTVVAAAAEVVEAPAQ
ncbi:MAG: hypothetical protein K2M83_09765 [Muribaculaceae bacterium]|nr:hypothetical protein [Muribaculaceae bacterium]